MNRDHPLEIDGLELDALNEKGKPVETRLKDVKSAISIFRTLFKADEKSLANFLKKPNVCQINRSRYTLNQ